MVRLFFSPDGLHLALGSKPILIWDLEEQSLVTSLEGDGRYSVTDFQYSPDGRWLAAEHTFWRLLVWNVENEKVQIRRESGPLIGEDTPGRIDDFAFSPDSALIAIGSETTIEIWDVEAASQLYTLQLGLDARAVWELSFSSDGTHLYTIINVNQEPVVEIWDLVERKLLQHYEFPEYVRVQDVYDQYVVLINDGQKKSEIEIWDIEFEKIKLSLVAPKFRTNCLAFSSNGEFLLAHDVDTPYVWDAFTGQLVFTMDDMEKFIVCCNKPKQRISGY